MTRCRLKGQALDYQISEGLRFLKENQTVDNWERVVNWFEGLLKCHTKRREQYDKVFAAIELCGKIRVKEKEGEQDVAGDLLQYSFEERKALWNDLIGRNKKWLKNGYHHDDTNNFLDEMAKLFQSRGETVNHIEELERLRNQAFQMENTHKFLF